MKLLKVETQDSEKMFSFFFKIWEFVSHASTCFEFWDIYLPGDDITNTFPFEVRSGIHRVFIERLGSKIQENKDLVESLTNIIFQNFFVFLNSPKKDEENAFKKWLHLCMALNLDETCLLPGISLAMSKLHSNALEKFIDEIKQEIAFEEVSKLQVAVGCLTSRGLLMVCKDSLRKELESQQTKFFINFYEKCLERTLPFVLNYSSEESGNLCVLSSSSNPRVINHEMLQKLWFLAQAIPRSGGPMFAKCFDKCLNKLFFQFLSVDSCHGSKNNIPNDSPSKKPNERHLIIWDYMKMADGACKLALGESFGVEFFRLVRQNASLVLDAVLGPSGVGDALAVLAEQTVFSFLKDSLERSKPKPFETLDSKSVAAETSETSGDYFARVLRSVSQLALVAFEVRNRVRMSRRAIQSFSKDPLIRTALHESETQLLSYLAAHCGSNFNTKAESMLDDVNSLPLTLTASPLQSKSPNNMDKFAPPSTKRLRKTEEVPRAETAAASCTIELWTLNFSAWPFAASYRAAALQAKGGNEDAEGAPLVSPFNAWMHHVSFPAHVIRDQFESVKEMYLKKYQGRMIVPCFEMSRVEVADTWTGDDNSTKCRTIYCSAFQAALLVSGQVQIDGKWRVEALRAGFHSLSQRELDRLSKSLVKTRVLVDCDPNTQGEERFWEISDASENVCDVFEAEFDCNVCSGLAWLGDGVAIGGKRENREKRGERGEFSSSSFDSISFFESCVANSMVNVCSNQEEVTGFGDVSQGGGVEGLVVNAQPYLIDASIIRFLKGSRKVSLNDLLMKVKENVSGIVTDFAVKARLKTLEEREYCSLGRTVEGEVSLIEYRT
eukprot:GDKJ01028809.1.p1 GENE.GDKJ01028809.1~~GDKJ01028809.1.p1  ORF type:complete len:916 (-),score=185.61 GDKJ01028809.1:76-2586(-)